MTALHMHLSQSARNRCKICPWLLWIPLHHLRMWNTVLKCSAGNLSIHMFQEYSNHKTCCRTDCLDDIPDYSSSQPLLFWPVFDWAMAAHGALVVIGRQAEANRSLGAGEVHNLSKVLNFPSWRKRVKCRAPTVAQRSNSFFLEKTRLCWLASYNDFPWFSSMLSWLWTTCAVVTCNTLYWLPITPSSPDWQTAQTAGPAWVSYEDLGHRGHIQPSGSLMLLRKPPVCNPAGLNLRANATGKQDVTLWNQFSCIWHAGA